MTIGDFSISPWLLITLLIIIFFRKHIIDWLKKHAIESIKSGQNELKFRDNQLQFRKSLVTRSIGKNPPDTEQAIFEDVKSFIANTIETKEPANKADQIESLLNVCANDRLNMVFLSIDTMIFGSQISILEHLEKLNNDTIEGIRMFYDNAKLSFSDIYKTISFDKYLQFLTNSRLIIDREKRYFITAFGKMYLRFRRQLNRTKYRPPL